MAAWYDIESENKAYKQSAKIFSTSETLGTVSVSGVTCSVTGVNLAAAMLFIDGWAATVSKTYGVALEVKCGEHATGGVSSTLNGVDDAIEGVGNLVDACMNHNAGSSVTHRAFRTNMAALSNFLL